MTLLPQPADRARTSVSIFAGLILAPTLLCAAHAQTPQAQAKSAPTTVETIRLAHVTAQRDFNDFQTDLRNMLPMAVIYAAQTQNALSIRATAEDIETAKKVIAGLDQPRKAYRVTYTFTDVENGKPAGMRHLTLLVVAGEKTIVKHGKRVPILTGMFEKDAPARSSQVQYLDVGLNVEATLDGDRLRSKLEQSTVSDEKSGIGIQDPIVGQTMLEATSDLKPGKTLALGSIDIPGTTRRQDIEVVAEQVQFQ
jgi:type II secretory pathway component GspD/PulD (secretin)